MFWQMICIFFCKSLTSEACIYKISCEVIIFFSKYRNIRAKHYTACKSIYIPSETASIPAFLLSLASSIISSVTSMFSSAYSGMSSSSSISTPPALSSSVNNEYVYIFRMMMLFKVTVKINYFAKHTR